MTETTQEERDHLRIELRNGRAILVEQEPLYRVLYDLDRLAAIEPDYDRAMSLIRMRGVPEQRAKHLTNALDVLLTRLDREIRSHRVVESAIERQVLWRTKDMPEYAKAWIKLAVGSSWWVNLHPLDGIHEGDEAPDYRPDEEGPIMLAIIEPPDRVEGDVHD